MKTGLVKVTRTRALSRHSLAAAKGQGILFCGNMEEKGPPGSASQISTSCGQLSLEVLVFTALKVSWSSEIPRSPSTGGILASVPVLTSVHHILHRQCHDPLFLEPSGVLWAWARLCVVTAGVSTSSHGTGCDHWELLPVHPECWAGPLLLHN